MMEAADKKLADLIKTTIARPMLLREIMRQLRLPPGDRKKIKRILAELVLRGDVVRTRGNRFGLAERMDLETGVFQAHADGYGFVIPEKKGRPDIYIAARARLDAMDGDKVMVRVSPPAGRRKPAGKREGVIVRILERARSRVVGTFEQPDYAAAYGFVSPSNPRITYDIIVPQQYTAGARPGDIVSVEILTYPLKGRPPEGRVLRVIGTPGQPGIEADLVIEEYELPVAFSPAAQEEAAAIPQTVTPAMRRGRKDLRHLPTVTIDGERAKDFDDALSIARIPGGYRLWVHIADVSAYVREGSALDQDAYVRATSVYLPDRVLPMLPPELSNGICSLNPGVDRLAFTVEMDFSDQGTKQRYDIYESVISSDERMTYTAVKEILTDRDPRLRRRYGRLLPQFELMEELMEVLRARRFRRGSIDFDLPEPEIVLDLQGRMTEIIRTERNRAHQIVEEFMLAANETVAGHADELGIPFLYRVHEPPDEDKIGELAEFLSTLGITLPVHGAVKPLTLQKVLAKARGLPVEQLVNTVLLRTLKQARYSAENVGHFGLAAATYSHFTSPIRRYPDLVVHRILKAAAGRPVRKSPRLEELAEMLPATAEHCSARERVAMDAERDVVTMLKIEFMRDKEGEEFRGVITGVANFGFFVQLTEFFVEGLVHVSSLADDYYHYIEKQHCLRGERKKKVYRIGDTVTVRVDRVNRERKRIDFSLAS